jgi:cyclic 2,3-diphosphoglycerate synthetase
VRGKDVFFTTTARGAAATGQIASLEAAHGCRVVGWSDNLADRGRLTQDMDGARRYEVLLTELKAAAIDVACRKALERGAEVVFVDNRAVVVEGDTDIHAALRGTIDLARQRRAKR